jgi:membrane protein
MRTVARRLMQVMWVKTQEYLLLAGIGIRTSLGIVRTAIDNFSQARSAEVAAGLAYYLLFSIFPFFIALIAGASYFIDQDLVFGQVLDIIAENFPASVGVIESNLRIVFDLRGQVGLLGLAVLIWAATGYLSSLVFNINRAWPNTKRRNFVRMRLSAILIVIMLAVLLILGSWAPTFYNLISRVPIPFYGRLEPSIWPKITNLAGWIVRWALFYLLYYFAPTTQVPKLAALMGAFVAGLLWELTSTIFLTYLTSGLARYELVYGSLTAIMVLMIWMYLNGLILLFGAHLSATIGTRHKDGEQ